MHIQWLELKSSDEGVLTRSPEVLEVPDNVTAATALQAIGYTAEQAGLLLEQRAVSVFGMYATENTVLHPNDRLEVLDGLKFDPMESRRRRAQHKTLTKRQKELARYERRSRKQSKTNT